MNVRVDLTDGKLTLVQVIAWCNRATSHYLSQCWPRSISPYGVTSTKRVKRNSWRYPFLRNLNKMSLYVLWSWSWPGPWFNIKMSSYQYRKSHCGDKTILRPSYLHNGISYTGKMMSFYWIGAQNADYIFTIVFEMYTWVGHVISPSRLVISNAWAWQGCSPPVSWKKSVKIMMNTFLDTMDTIFTGLVTGTTVPACSFSTILSIIYTWKLMGRYIVIY